MAGIIKVGIVGTGIIAHEHAGALEKRPGGCMLMAAADLDETKAKKFADAYGLASSCSSVKEMIGGGEIDLVVVATPPCFHEEVVTEALRSGLHVLCEKPLAHTLLAARRMVELTREFPNHLTVGYQLRYAPERARLRSVCQLGGVGQLRSAEVSRHGQIPDMHQRGDGWWGKWDVAGGGVAITQMIHELDLLIQIMGKPLAVSARMATQFSEIESEDSYEAEVEFENGGIGRCSGSVNSGWIGGGFRISGVLGTIDVNGCYECGDEQLKRDVVNRVNQELPKSKPLSTGLPARILRRLKRRLVPQKENPFPAHLEFYRQIGSAISAGGEMPVTPEDSMAPLELCMAIYESAIRGERVDMPLADDCQVFGGISRELYAKAPSDRPIATGLEPASGKGALRVGLLGLDTSHAPTFTNLLNNADGPDHLVGATVVAAYPGGSDDMEMSYSRVDAFTDQLRNLHQVAILDDPVAVARDVDVVIMTAVDGRTHVDLLEKVAPEGKPVFIDKPFAVSLRDAKKMFKIADEAKIQLFASSIYRYGDGFVNLLSRIREADEKVEECEVVNWLPIQETQGRYFWYGIHASEMLVAVLGVGASRAKAVTQGDVDEIQVEYKDGRKGRIVGHQTDASCRVRIRTDKGTHELDLTNDVPTFSVRALEAALANLAGDKRWCRLWRASAAGSIGRMRTSQAVDPDRKETLDVIGILDAAQRSLKSNEWVNLDDCNEAPAT